MIIALVIILIIISEIHKEQDYIAEYIANKLKERTKKKGTKFYNSNAWHKAVRECKRLQMERTGLNHIMCEQCGCTSLDLEYGKPIRMSVGHDKARSLYPELALEQDNLYVQCMPCNLAQGVERRLYTGYNCR